MVHTEVLQVHRKSLSSHSCLHLGGPWGRKFNVIFTCSSGSLLFISVLCRLADASKLNCTIPIVKYSNSGFGFYIFTIPHCTTLHQLSTVQTCPFISGEFSCAAKVIDDNGIKHCSIKSSIRDTIS